ncbi:MULTISPECIES: glycerophosphodiester phosphodiesterase [Ramlibacter]|uniref:Glycerophosphodiester phosphodiesterase n=1 Tax=Ramlibacter aquaticus TaxID=2780094 RepID=A0ABR9SB40_9BURK|nr:MULTISPECIES: glycerophosphodiester phosphodiesterase [Ramlibacter]MBE7939543.1 glycerophosphodiester phosphodiesterase [Ramlibacter aquaticus]
MSAAPSPWPYPRWIAHRGAGKLAPENTLAAFRLGAAQGFRMAECDVKLAADGLPFLLHDATLDRTTNAVTQFGPAASRVAGEHPWAELATLDAGSWHSRAYAGEPLPTLEGIARHCLANGLLLNIEIKPTPGTERFTGEVVARHAARLWNDAPVPPLLSSFKPEALEGARASAGHLPRGLLLDSLHGGWCAQALGLGCVAVVLNHTLWSLETVREAKDAGLRCLAYTVNDEWAAQRLLALGLDGIITDRVDLFSPG